jgi:hypothetical protein
MNHFHERSIVKIWIPGALLSKYMIGIFALSAEEKHLKNYATSEISKIKRNVTRKNRIFQTYVQNFHWFHM